jgi:hypothetical protein
VLDLAEGGKVGDQIVLGRLLTHAANKDLPSRTEFLQCNV